MPDQTGFFPQQVAIAAYGNGGFRFGDMSHIGAVLALPDGMRAWQIGIAAEALAISDFEAVFGSLVAPAVFLFGTGAEMVLPSDGLRQSFRDRGLTLEAMSTGAAARTYNVLLAEGRNIGAGLLPVL